MIKNRDDYLTWDQYFMAIAVMSAKRSKDHNTQVGACIVYNSKIIGTGYNGLPYGFDDTEFDWNRKGDYYKTKYPYIVHAELNAILNVSMQGEVRGSKLYCTLFPCHECAKAIVQSGITEVYFMEDKYDGSPSNLASKLMFRKAGVLTQQICNEGLDETR